LALQHDFKGAQEVKRQVDELQRRETVEAEKMALKSVQQNYEKLLVMQKRELECAEANDIRKLKQMENEMQRERETVQKLNWQVETRINNKRSPFKKSGLPVNSRETIAQIVSRKGRPNSEAQRLDIRLPDIRTVLAGKAK
jgi:hypothetical protein